MKRSRRLSLDLMQGSLAAAGKPEQDDGSRHRLLRAMKRAESLELTPRQRECVELYYGKQVSQKEIAKQLGITPATVCRHLKKARGRLYRVLRYFC